MVLNERWMARMLRNQKQSLDGLSKLDYDSMAETVVAAALDGHYWAVQEIAKAIDG
jgi:hypothetical protein